MGTLSVQPQRKHGSVFWVLISLLIVLAVLVAGGIALWETLSPGTRDAIFIFVTFWTGHGGPVPQ